MDVIAYVFSPPVAVRGRRPLRAAAAILALLGTAGVSTLDSPSAADFVGDGDDGFEYVSGPPQIASSAASIHPDLVAARARRVPLLATLPAGVGFRLAPSEALSRFEEAAPRSQRPAGCLRSRAPPRVWPFRFMTKPAKSKNDGLGAANVETGSSPNTNRPRLSLNTVLKIEIDGSAAFSAGCFSVSASDTAIKRLVINGFENGNVVGISLRNGAFSNDRIEGKFIGLDATGMHQLNQKSASLRGADDASDPSTEVLI
jgi:hypothetical protein